MLSLFYLMALLILWPYCFYPLVLLILKVGFAKKIAISEKVSQHDLLLLICFRSQEEFFETHLMDRVLNAVEHMPELSVILIGDGVELELEPADSRIRLLAVPKSGKNICIFEALKSVELRENLILGFSDSNTLWDHNHLRDLMSWLLKRPDLGLAGAKLAYLESNHPEARHQRLENWFRRQESEILSVAGVSGGLMFIRSHLMRPFPSDWPIDLALPLQLGITGVRSGFASEIVVLESLKGILSRERRQRTIGRGISCSLSLFGKLLRTNVFLAFALMSRKILRFVWILTVPFFCFLFVWHYSIGVTGLFWLLVLPIAIWPVLFWRHLSDSCLGLIGAWVRWFSHSSVDTWKRGQ